MLSMFTHSVLTYCIRSGEESPLLTTRKCRRWKYKIFLNTLYKIVHVRINKKIRYISVPWLSKTVTLSKLTSTLFQLKSFYFLLKVRTRRMKKITKRRVTEMSSLNVLNLSQQWRGAGRSYTSPLTTTLFTS